MVGRGRPPPGICRTGYDCQQREGTLPPKQLRRRHQGAEITVSYDIARCIHAAKCVLGLPTVFNREWADWIDPAGATPERIASVVYRCPSGALRVADPQGSDLESPRSPNTIHIRPNGPLYLRGDLRIIGASGEQVHADTRMALCRCGASGNKPFCDNSHLRVEFVSGTEIAGAQQPAGGGGPLRIMPQRNGPYELEGNLEIRDRSGQLLYQGASTRLCRCGASKEQPFCDDSHLQFDFEAAAW